MEEKDKKDMLEGLIPDAKKICEMHPEILEIMKLESDEEKKEKLSTLPNDFARAIIISTYREKDNKIDGLKTVKGSIGRKIIMESFAEEKTGESLLGLSLEELDKLNENIDKKIHDTNARIEELEKSIEEYKRKKLIELILANKEKLKEREAELKAKEEEYKKICSQMPRNNNQINKE